MKHDSVVMYLLTGPAHAANAAVSLLSLRNWWSGPVYVFAWPESFDFAAKMCGDPRINATPLLCSPGYKKKNAQEIHKIALIQEIDFADWVLYIDADTIVSGALAPLIELAKGNENGFAATQFCNWWMKQAVPRGRVERLLRFPEIPEKLVRASCRPDQPAYNSGVFVARPSSPVLPVWGEWTTISKSVFISGESSLHPIAQKFAIATDLGGRFNNSPMFQHSRLPDSDVRVWHFHGDCNVRPSKSTRGVDLWWPAFRHVYKQDVGGIRGWVDQIGNEFLPKLMVERGLS